MKAKKRILIFIVAYNAEKHIENVLDRIPEPVYNNSDYSVDVLIIDDCSSDATIEKCQIYLKNNAKFKIFVMSTPTNQGYGGNQKLGYLYAVKNGYDAVVLLHGDGQYDPGKLGEMITPVVANKADVVFGSRMLTKQEALKGGMPYYKFVGNQILTRVQNFLLRSSLSEFHTGYRAYRVESLAKIPFHCNSNKFDFDTDIIIQLMDTSARILEIPIPTHYGDEICHVNGLRYAWDIVKSTIVSRLQKYNVLYDPKFDYIQKTDYQSKTDFDSSHRFAIDAIQPGSTVIDIGCANGHVARKLVEKKCTVYGMDYKIADEAKKYFKEYREMNIEQGDIAFAKVPVHTILMLDIIEHLDNPEEFLNRLRVHFAPDQPQVILTTANISFFPMRILLLLGQFNYGKKGILDLTHKRLFTFSSFVRMLKYSGYKIERVDGIPVPFNLIFGEGTLSKIFFAINKFLIKISKGLFSYQIAVITKPKLTLEQTYVKIIDHTTEAPLLKPSAKS